ncbi:MAG: hypothetical protein H8E98_02995 [Bacteroidetes bacterium]|nr:hypothetical protein [Bacteroidota bacterium]
MKFNKERLVHYFVITIFGMLYAFIATISSIHVVDFFELSNNLAMSICLAVAFEMGAAASLASVVVLDKMNKTLIWSLFILLTAFQCIGNVYYAYVHLEDFRYWIELFGLNTEPLIVQKRIISTVSGAILPIVALGFIKALVDYIKPSENIEKEDSKKQFEDKNQEEIESANEEDDKLWDIMDDGEPEEEIEESKKLETKTDEDTGELDLPEKSSTFNDIIDKAIKPKEKHIDRDTYDEKQKSYLDVRK